MTDQNSELLATKNCDWDFKSFDDSTGEFSAYFAYFGNVDRAQEILEPGSIANVSQFARDGWIGTNHKMDALPVAMPLSAVQDSRGFLVHGKFHSHPEAQACRTVVKERLAAGLTVKGSIGYKVTDSYRDTLGSEPIRRLKSIDLFEASFVNLPANPKADVMSVKAVEALETKSDQLNSAGNSFAKSLIKAKKVSTGSWSFSADDGNALLGSDKENPDWVTYGKCHLATSSDGDPGTKDHYKYPFAKKVGGEITLFQSALTAIRSRASQQEVSGVFDAAGKLLKMLKPDDDDGKAFAVERTTSMADLAEKVLTLSELGGWIESRLKSKSGRVISAANREKLQGWHQQMTELSKQIKELLAAHEPDEDDDDDEDDAKDDGDEGTMSANGKAKKAAKPKSKPPVKDAADGDPDDDEDEEPDGDEDDTDDDDKKCRTTITTDGSKAKTEKKCTQCGCKFATRTKRTTCAKCMKAGDPRNAAGNAIVGQGGPTADDIKSQIASTLDKARKRVLNDLRSYSMLPDKRN